METNSKTLINLIEEYLHFCTARKNLDTKTIKSYSIDLKQYADFLSDYSLDWNDKKSIEKFIEFMHSKFKPKSVKRKIASLKAFFHLYYKGLRLLSKNTWRRVCSGAKWQKLREGLKNAYNLTSKTEVIPNLSPKFC